MITIQYLNPSPAQVRVHGDNFGRVFLDVSSEYEVRLTKALDQIDETEQISQEAALSGSLRATNKNRAVLEQFRPDAINRNTDVIQVEVLQDGDRLPLTGAAVLGFDEATDEYEFELFGDDWIDKLQEIVLRSLDLGSFEYTIANIEAAWSGPRQTIAIPAVCHFGKFETTGQVSTEDLRFFFNIYEVLKQAFCQIGWNFVCENYAFGYGQYLYAYLSAKNYHWYEGKQAEAFVHVNVATPRNQPAAVDFIVFDEVYDPGDLYNNPFFPDRYYYGTTGLNATTELRIQFRDFVVDLPPSPTGQSPYFLVIGIQKIRPSQVTQVHAEIIIGSSDQAVTRTINFDYIDLDAQTTDTYRVFISYSNINQDGNSFLPYTIQSGDVYFRPDPPYYIEGDTINLGDLLSDEITCLDLFQAASELINGRIVTDVASKTVTLFPPYTYSTQTATIEGFHKTNLPPLDFRSNTITDLTSWEDKAKEEERYRLYSFASSNDEFLSSDSYFNRRVDLKTGLPKELKIENSLFEATGEIKATAAEVGGTGNIAMPALWDNDSSQEPARSFDINPRLVINYGLTDQNQTWDFEGTIKTEFPYMAQVAGINLPANIEFIPISFNSFTNDLYTLFFSRDIEQLKGSSRILYNLILSDGDRVYKTIDFRRTILVRDRDSDLEMRVLSIRDHLVGSRVPILINSTIA